MKIGNRKIGRNRPVFVVAEAGINHDGSVEKALEMVHAAQESGADAFKVQAFAADHFVTARATWKGESQAEMFRRYELKRDDFARIAEECRKVGLVFFGTPDCMEHARWLVEAGAEAIKVGSDDLTNTPLIRDLAAFGLPMILSTGMGTLTEVDDAINAASSECAVLYCCSIYPAPLDALRLRAWLPVLQDKLVTIGFSDHTEGATAAAVSVALGARIIEKHFTLDSAMPGPDHRWSADPKALAEYVRAIRNTETACTEYAMPPEEVAMRVTARRSIVAAHALPAGHVLTADDIAFKRPGDGLAPDRAGLVIGRKLLQPLAEDEQIRMGYLC